MKKGLFLTVMFSFILFFATSISVFADGGSWTHEELANATWSYDGAGTLTLDGHYTNAPVLGYAIPPNLITWKESDTVPWSAYENEIRHIVLKGDFSFRTDKDFDLTGSLDNGFSWHYDLKTNALTLSGKGSFPYSNTFYSVPDNLETLSIGDDITSVKDIYSHTGTGWGPYPVQTVIIGKGLTADSSFTPVKNFVLDPQNPNLTLYDGVLYSKDYKIALNCPTSKTSVSFPTGVKTIGKGAFAGCNIAELVLPWGVESIQSQALALEGGSSSDPRKVVFPDTVIEVIDWGGICEQRPPIYVKAYYSKYNEILSWAYDRHQMNYGFEIGVPLESTEAYYPGAVFTGWRYEGERLFYYEEGGNRAVGWRKIDGRWYYFMEDGRMARDWWIETDGCWYYVRYSGVMAANEWIRNEFQESEYYFVDRAGIMLANRWLLRDGHWYYMNSGGRRVQNRWVYYPGDRKYYYLGADGAMLTDTVTPDGYKVDKNGAWIA